MDLQAEVEDIDFGPPYYTDSTPPPPQYGMINRYIIQKDLLDKPTKCSYVYKCTDSLDNQVKVIKFVKLYENKLERIKNEVATMRILSHPNIIKSDHFFRHESYLCIVLPYTPHRSLLWFLVQFYKSGMPEDIAVPIMHQMFKALEHLHNQNIWHRDIKPDNILLFDSNSNLDIIPDIPINSSGQQSGDTNNSNNTNDQNDSTNDQNDTNNENNSSIPISFTSLPKAVLSDFGFAKVFNPGEKSEEYLGTPEYVAPEMVNHVKYDKSVDIWSLGISLFVMLTGRFPFPRSYCSKRISKGHLNFELLNSMGISDEAQDLIRKMCALDPKDRITATDAINHPWILSRQKTPIEMDYAALIGNEGEYEAPPGI